jgi:hypothetical protein
MPNTITYTVTRSNNLNGAATLSYGAVGTGSGPALAGDLLTPPTRAAKLAKALSPQAGDE